MSDVNTTGGKMFLVKLRSGCHRHTEEVQFDAAICYQPSIDEAMKAAPKIPVFEGLYKTGHHTTQQHAESSMKFVLDNIPVSLVTFGLHLTHPFYNTSQRSGRYCRKMFYQPYSDFVNDFIDLAAADSLVKANCLSLPHQHSYDDVVAEMKRDILEWIDSGVNFFKENIDEVTEATKKVIMEERPNFPGNLDIQAERIAQEQLRNYISTIFPTGMAYTINLTTLVAMYHSAWNHPYKVLLGRMISEASKSYPILNEIIPTLHKDVQDSWVPNITYSSREKNLVQEDPDVMAVNIGDNDITNLLKSDIDRFKSFHSHLDCLHFNPNTYHVKYTEKICESEVGLSVAAFGQDQRHRTIERSAPEITGMFMMPKLLTLDQFKDKADQFTNAFMHRYLELCIKYSLNMMIHFIPYGAVVRYYRKANMKAWYHCQSKRLCNNAQGEISYVERVLNELVFEEHPELKPTEPCVDGNCIEGKRFCGRDLKNRLIRELI